MTPSAVTAPAPAPPNATPAAPIVNRRVTIAEAVVYQREGSFIVNPRYGQHNEPARIWRARWLVHYRPMPFPELNQYATITEVS